MSWLSAQESWEKTTNSQPLKEQFALEWKNDSLVIDNKNEHMYFSSQPCGSVKIGSTLPCQIYSLFLKTLCFISDRLTPPL